MPVVSGDRAFVDTLWPLYKQTGEKNGFTVLTEEDFYKFHLTVEGLVVMMVTVGGRGWGGEGEGWGMEAGPHCALLLLGMTWRGTHPRLEAGC